ncbi:MAG: hypothetical protein WBE20_08315 [Candidatus Acidiferrales bacterium]
MSEGISQGTGQESGQGTEVAHFRGVACLHCGEPIHLTPRVAILEAALRGAAASGADAGEPRRFVTWCEACEREAPYFTNEVEDFDGSAATREHAQRPVVVPWRHYQPAARAKTV